MRRIDKVYTGLGAVLAAAAGLAAAGVIGGPGGSAAAGAGDCLSAWRGTDLVTELPSVVPCGKPESRWRVITRYTDVSDPKRCEKLRAESGYLVTLHWTGDEVDGDASLLCLTMTPATDLADLEGVGLAPYGFGEQEFTALRKRILMTTNQR
ncbi:LppU/SCO3897 family protein [Yinghuangia soli]|uniref:Uncharacterized protein n=1 Tax=Yinghuangia soli TaxID=2908204 RepID=A0AA41Q334_9ACTN|nr:hypothetical protein [Yinghuangia soli]MCF2530659.1 hypothetical protein [Yinghuangia soli]